jgi:hypothetical protein
MAETIAFKLEQHIIKDVLLLLCKIAENSDRLINNSTTNLAECCFSSDWVFALQKSEQSLCCPKIYTEFLMSALSFLTAVVLSKFF